MGAGIQKLSYPIPSMGTLPRIEGLASLTPDGNMVCELDYKIIYENNIKNYVVYNLDFLPKVRCPCQKRSIPATVDCLIKSGKIVDEELFVGYAVTRLILSQELFGKFDTKYLLQRYYSCFLDKLRESVWKAFLPFFEDPKYEVKNYYLLFK